MSDGCVEIAANELPWAGHWTVCYCPNFGGCDDADEFMAPAGTLTVSGALPGNSFSCSRLEYCMLEIAGVDFNTFHTIKVAGLLRQLEWKAESQVFQQVQVSANIVTLFGAGHATLCEYSSTAHCAPKRSWRVRLWINR